MSAIRKLAATLLLAWGLLNALGGALGAREQLAPGFDLLFFGVGLVIVIGALGFWARRRWAVWVTLAGLIGLSLVALASAHQLRGPENMRISHHVVRLIISGALFVLAVVGLGRERGRSGEPGVST